MNEIQLQFKIADLEEKIGIEELKLKRRLAKHRAELKSLRIKMSFYTGNRQRGPTKKRDDNKIRQLRAEGLSMKAIAIKLGISTTPVQAALKGAE